MKTFITTNELPKILFVNFLCISIILLLTELFLALFFPYNIATIGHVYSQNAVKYGWGYNPHELVKIADPDTGEIYTSLTNNHGWRDTNRSFINHKNTYRILVLGDSVTFGGIVPADKIYTRTLEDKLTAEGFRVEVINISYGGWGTDQELEALKNEGLKYNPHLVIIQFTHNDLNDNIYLKFPEKQCSKPFYYTLDENTNLIRNENPCFTTRQISWKYTIKLLINKSEILKRIYGLYLSYKLREEVQAVYTIDQKNIEQIETVLSLKEDSKFLNYLRNRLGRNIDKQDIVKAIYAHGQELNEEIILRMLEKRWFKKYWSRNSFYVKYPNMNEPRWKLYFALIFKASNLANKMGANLAIISDNEIGYYEWETYWCRIKDDQVSRINYLAITRIIEEFANKNGIGFVKNIHKHSRARNDLHPNIEGNYAMAENIYQYLMTYHRKEIFSYSR